MTRLRIPIAWRVSALAALALAALVGAAGVSAQGAERP